MIAYEPQRCKCYNHFVIWLIAPCHRHKRRALLVSCKLLSLLLPPSLLPPSYLRRLVPTFTDISSSLAPLYIETAMFALRAQQRITNSDSRSAYVLNNATRYLSLVQLHTTASRLLQLHDQLLFLQSGEHPFIPDDPWGTLFA